MSNDKVAAIWCRVSTHDQREASPDTQIQEALALAQQEGYHVPDEYILGTDWHSLTVWESPPMERLKELIRGRTIPAIFTYDADRGPSNGSFSARCARSTACAYGAGTVRCRTAIWAR